MMMKKLSEEHYIIVDDSEIKEGDWIYDLDTPRIVIADSLKVHTSKKEACWYYKKITRSTEPLDKSLFFTNRVWGCERLSLGEVKELIGVVDVEKKADEEYYEQDKSFENDIDPFLNYSEYLKVGFIDGYNQALEDNKDKKYTEEDLNYLLNLLTYDDLAEDEKIESCIEYIKDLLQLKTEWEVEFVDGILKLKK